MSIGWFSGTYLTRIPTKTSFQIRKKSKLESSNPIWMWCIAYYRCLLYSSIAWYLVRCIIHDGMRSIMLSRSRSRTRGISIRIKWASTQDKAFLTPAEIFSSWRIFIALSLYVHTRKTRAPFSSFEGPTLHFSCRSSLRTSWQRHRTRLKCTKSDAKKSRFFLEWSPFAPKNILQKQCIRSSIFVNSFILVLMKCFKVVLNKNEHFIRWCACEHWVVPVHSI
jgi:hypothetical protein